jgi:Flp pilus assembly protein TadG
MLPFFSPLSSRLAGVASREAAGSLDDRAAASRRAAREAGQELVEFALILPLLLLFLGIIEVGRLMFSYSTIANAAREGARYDIVAPNNLAGIDAATRRLIIGLACDPLKIPQRVVTATTVAQTVHCQFKTVIGNLIPALAEVPLSSTATLQKGILSLWDAYADASG